VLRHRPRRLGAACAAQEAESKRDGLDNFIVAGKGRRVGGLFYFTSLLRKRDRCVWLAQRPLQRTAEHLGRGDLGRS
jgi:hypothetical protein